MNTAATSSSVPVRTIALTKQFGSGSAAVIALNSVSMTVQRSEMVAIIGASGSGKSTLLHLIAGLTHATKGSVEIDGMNLAEMRDRKLTIFRRRHLGLVFQAFNLIPTLNVVDNIQLPLLMESGGREEKSKLEPLLEFLGLKDRRHHRPDQLSGGEQQRVAITRALINNPSVLLADEPTGNLDSINSQKLCELLRSLSRTQGRTVIVVTHDPAVAVWADRVMVLRDGKFVGSLTRDQYPTAKELGVQFQELNGAGRTATGSRHASDF